MKRPHGRVQSLLGMGLRGLFVHTMDAREGCVEETAFEVGRKAVVLELGCVSEKPKETAQNAASCTSSLSDSDSVSPEQDLGICIKRAPRRY